jgi:hypothetical protein
MDVIKAIERVGSGSGATAQKVRVAIYVYMAVTRRR